MGPFNPCDQTVSRLLGVDDPLREVVIGVLKDHLSIGLTDSREDGLLLAGWSGNEVQLSVLANSQLHELKVDCLVTLDCPSQGSSHRLSAGQL